MPEYYYYLVTEFVRGAGGGDIVVIRGESDSEHTCMYGSMCECM